MHDTDPHQEPSPVASATPVVDPINGPVSTVVVETEHRTSPNPYPYIAGLVLLVLGLWGVFAAFNDRDQPREPKDVAYVEQDLEPRPSPFANRPRSTARMAEDQAQDELRDLRRREVMAGVTEVESATLPQDRTDDSAAGDPTVIANFDQVASVDLSEPAANTDPNPEIAVLNLDYSAVSIAALPEAELNAILNQIDADLEATEAMAKETGQLVGLEILDERLDALEERIDDTPKPMTETDRLIITRRLNELRDEVSAFQNELQAL